MSIDLTQFHQAYFDESFELLDVMENVLLEFEGTGNAPERDSIDTIFRAAHSIKGGAGTFGFKEIAEFTHLCETLLDQVRSGARAMTSESRETLLSSLDCTRSMLAARRDGSDLSHEQIEIVRASMQGILDAACQAPDPTTASPGAAPVAEREAAPVGERWVVEFSPHVDLLRTGNDPVRLIQEVSRLAPVDVTCDMTAVPPISSLDPEECFLRWTLRLAEPVPREAIIEVFEWVEDECDLGLWTPSECAAKLENSASITPTTQDESRANAAPNPSSSSAVGSSSSSRGVSSPNAIKATASSSVRKPTSESQSIRVSIDKVDELINMVGELVITQSMLQQFGECEHVETDLLRDKLALLHRNTRELQESVMRIRMLPISFAFNRFPRMVHDLSNTLGKKVRLELAGEQTELDKTVMEKISDPLVHLVRNSLDHGIEMPDARLQAGKPEEGTLELNAYHQGGNIVIEISDDGGGINKQRVLERAIERGLIADAEGMSDERIYDLIFLPGFSTAESISDISGRGVGMDVVRRNIASIGGTISLNSAEGKGSTVTIRLPLTLAILDGQTVRVGTENYILPLVSIIESIQVQPGEVNRIAGRLEVIRLRDEYLPIIRMYRILDVTPQTMSLSEGLVVVVEADRQKVGLFVDELLGQQQVVIKSLETNFKRVDGISGATILGDGTVALILDVPGLVTLSKIYGQRSDDSFIEAMEPARDVVASAGEAPERELELATAAVSSGPAA